MKTGHIMIDFGKSEKFPLIKTKFGFFNSAYVPYDRWIRDVSLLKKVKPVSVRYEIGWGMGTEASELLGNKAFPQEYNAPQIDGTLEQPKIHFEQMDGFVASLLEQGITPFLINCYSPVLLQKAGEDYTAIPSSLEVWEQINEQFAAHFAECFGPGAVMYEIWNEPDLEVFFAGDMEDFFRVYEAGARGVRKGDPAAKVGGPALSVTHEWAAPFLDYVSAHDVPLDFFSFHMFAEEDQEAWIQTYREVLATRKQFSGTELILSEYNPLSFQKNGKDFHEGGFIEQYGFAQEVLHQIRFFLEQTDVSMVNWAQFNDPSVFGKSADRCGVVRVDGIVKPAYHAFELYADMPEERCFFETDMQMIEGMASVDNRKAAIVFWNRGQEEIQVLLQLRNLPFGATKAKVYRIDKNHGNQPEKGEAAAFLPEEISLTKAEIQYWSIPPKGVVYMVTGKEK